MTTTSEAILLTRDEVLRRLGIGKNTLYGLRRDGTLRPTFVGPQTVRYHVHDVEECARTLRERRGAA